MQEKRYVFVENARSEEYRKKLEFIEELGIDPFAEEYLTDPRFGIKNFLHRTDHWIVFTNQHKYPGTKHQFMIVSRQYAEAVWELPPEAQIELHTLCKMLIEENNILGCGIFYRFGIPSKSGATASHLHVQLSEPEDGHAIAAWFGKE